MIEDLSGKLEQNKKIPPKKSINLVKWFSLGLVSLDCYIMRRSMVNDID